MNSRQRMLAGAGLIALAVSFEGAAMAQVLEEIIVTARKRDESLQDIPITVTALTAEDIKERGIGDLYTLSQYTPGFYMEQTGNRRSNPSFRGLVLNTTVEERQNSSVFVDGFFVSGSAGTFGFNDVERVEVLKGPQSALFGRATFGGAINFITKLPGDEFEAELDATIAEFGEQELAGTMMGPISDKIGIKLSSRYHRFDGMWRNLNDGRKVGQLETKAVSGTMVFDPIDNLRLIVRAAYAKDDDGVPPSTLLTEETYNCLIYSEPPARDGYTCGKVPDVKSIRADTSQVEARYPGFKSGLLQSTYRYSAELIYDLSDWEINARAAFNKQYAVNTGDASFRGPIGAQVFNGRGGTFGQFGLNQGGRLGIIHLNQSDQDFRDRAFELRVSSPADQSIYGFLGVSWFEQDILRSNRRQDAARTLNFQLDNDTDNKNYSAFGSINWQATDRFRVGADARWQADTVQEMTGPVQLRPVSQVTLDAVVTQPVKGKVRFKTFLPRLLVDYKPQDDYTIYGLASRGNKPGFFNNAAVAALLRRPAVVDEEFVWNYELGAKTVNLDGRWVLNVAAYYLDWTDQQVRQTFLDDRGQASTIATNAGKTEGYGFELETTFAVTESFILNGSLARTKAEYKEFDEDTFSAQLGIPASQAGNQTPRFPDWAGAIGGSYSQPAMGDWRYVLRSDLSFTGKRWDDIYNLAYLGWDYKWNAKVGIENDNWKLSLFVDNILDDNNPSGVFRFRD
ncbi:MAG: TonB-dependent receptor, partial [Rhodospirillaceae bacterium]|nr:TonB-dependent receptor [Rhodospirillaceae bacterium]